MSDHLFVSSVIKYEGNNDTFVWKYLEEDFNYGSQLIVHESQEALFFKDGQALDLFKSGRYTLETQNLPLLKKAFDLVTDRDNMFHSEVYFINKTTQMGVKWGTPNKVKFIDPLTKIPLQIGMSGEMNLQVSDSRKLVVKLVGNMKGITWDVESSGLAKSLQASFRPLITSALKNKLSSVIKDNSIDILDIDSELDVISSALREALLPDFEEYGLTIPQFYVTNVVLPEEDSNFQKIRELHATTLQTQIFEAEAKIKIAQAEKEKEYRLKQEESRAIIENMRREAELQKQKTETEIAKQEAERKVISATADVTAQRMSGLTDAEIMRAKGYSEKDVLQAEVQKSYAKAIGEMGPTTVNGGSNTAASGIVNDMLGLGVGIAAASAVAPQIGTMMQGLKAPQTQQNGNGWDCNCGTKGISGNFCPNCGAKKPKPVETWDCACGQTGIRGKFCSNCGAKRPEKWDCACGYKGIIGNFCPNCGNPKPATWDCSCGRKGNKGKFCDNCGKKQGE